MSNLPTEQHVERVPVEHSLKCWPEHWTMIQLGYKRFEVRKNDRNFWPGDVLTLAEFIPNKVTPGQEHPEGKFTGRVLKCRVNHIVTDHPGIQPGYCVMSITEIL